jgi:signal transduction histidine kinase
MANEAISNAVRHSHATVIHIRVRQGDGQFEVVIEDDGKGFDLNNLTDSTGLGLRNIQQRAVLHGGHVTVDTAPGKGTRLTITMPLQLL